MKRILNILLVLAMVFSLTACGDKVKNDETFVKNLGNALEARWKITDNTKQTSNEDTRNVLSSAIDAEEKKLGAYEDYTFENEKIAEYAKLYFDSLAKQKEGFKYYGTDEEKYNEVFGSGLVGRYKAIYLINNEMPLSLSKSNGDNLDQFLQSGKIIFDEDAKLAAVEKMLQEGITAEFDGDQYQIIFENKTGYDFDSIDFTVNYYDKDGVLTDYSSCYLNNWKNGTKMKESLWTYGTSFKTAKISASYYRSYIDMYEQAITDEYELNLINDYKINIELKTELPVELAYSLSSGRVYSKCRIDSFDYNEGYWSDGSASINLIFSGEKTYDRKGNSNNDNCHFAWKLYDEEGIVVDSGSAYTNDITVGQTFKDVSSSAYDIKPGNYVLELTNY